MEIWCDHGPQEGLDRASIVKKIKPKNCSGGHLTRTQKAEGSSEESMQNHSAWIVKCTFKDFGPTWRNVLIYGLYSSYR